MKKNQKLDKSVLTPTTKHEEHDRPLSSKDVIEGGYMTKDQWEKVADISLKLFKRGEEIALTHGLILVDTKYEFGLDENNEIKTKCKYCSHRFAIKIKKVYNQNDDRF